LKKEIIAREQVHLVYLSVQNIGERTLQVTPLVQSSLWHGNVRIMIIPRTVDPWFTVDWTRSLEEFKSERCPVASAFLQAYRNKRSVSLSGKGVPQPFVLLFSLKDSNDFHFPIASPYPVKMGTHTFRLNFEVKGSLFIRKEAYRVTARLWSSVTVDLIPTKQSSRLRRFFSRKSSEQF
jgi:hypothetical protein